VALPILPRGAPGSYSGPEHMIHCDIIAEARRLLVDGASYRAVARRLGISRGTVWMIATGKRGNYPARDKAPEPGIDSSLPKSRCPECGGMVEIPCVVCRTRREMAGRKRRPPHPADETDFAGELGFDLRPEHRKRLEKIQQARNVDPRSPIPRSCSSRYDPTDQQGKWWYVDVGQLIRFLSSQPARSRG